MRSLASRRTTEGVVFSPPKSELAREAPLLQIQGLTRRFGERVALDSLSFKVYPGEIFGLLGPNGAGKSTAFQILACILRADSGRLFFRGRELALDDASLRTQMGIVFQSNSLDDQLTARENLLLGARLYGVRRSLAKTRVEAMLDLIELRARAKERVATWSGGMRRRLELARALVHEPQVLLMDEPTQGLDEASFRKFWSHLCVLRAQSGLTVILTTHRAEEAGYCDHLGLLDEGKLVVCESPNALAARIGGDVITLETPDVDQAVELLRQRFDLDPRVVDGRIQVERREGHALIPRLVEAFPPGKLSSVSLRRPNLADAFVKLTGHVLGGDVPEAASVEAKRRA